MDQGYNAIPFHNADFLLLRTGVGFITYSCTEPEEKEHASPCLWLRSFKTRSYHTTVLTAVSFAQFRFLSNSEIEGYILTARDRLQQQRKSTFSWAKQKAGAQASVSGFLVQRYSMNPSAVPDGVQTLLPLPHSRFVPFLPTGIRAQHKKYQGEGLILPIYLLLSNISHLHFMAFVVSVHHWK